MNQNIRTDLKLLVVGPTYVGKTSFTNRWTKDVFKDNYKQTVVSEFGFKIHESKGKLYRIQLWDLAGQDQSLTLTKIFAKDSHGCVIISDSTNLKSLETCLEWKNCVTEAVKFIDGGTLPFILVQNKIDLIENREDFVKIEEETKNKSEDNYFEKYFMTSVKQNVNVEEAMNFLIDNIINRLEEYAKSGNIIFNEQKQRDTIVIQYEKNSVRGKKKKKCC